MLLLGYDVTMGPTAAALLGERSPVRGSAERGRRLPCRSISPFTSPIGPNVEATPLISAGWYTDPTGRYSLRWWDGTAWTPHTASAGRLYFDPEAARGEADPHLRWILPIGRDPVAIAAGYIAFAGFLIFPAPIALLVGLVAAVRLHRRPGRLGWARTIFALVIGGLGSLALVLLAAIPGN